MRRQRGEHQYVVGEIDAVDGEQGAHDLDLLKAVGNVITLSLRDTFRDGS